MPKKSGFTLIELLVVITIIGILSVVGITAYTSLTTKAKDIKKKADIDQIAAVYELRYDTKTHKYKVLADKDFSNNKPDTTNYTGVLSEDGQTFNICATLSDKTTYCKGSAHQASVVFVPPVITSTPTPIPTSTPTPAPVITPPCTSNSPWGQFYAPNVYICVGYKTFDSAPSACTSDYHVCILDEYTKAGGDSKSPFFQDGSGGGTSNAWLSSTAGTNYLSCPTSMCGTSTCTAWSSGNTWGMATNAGKSSMANSCSAITTSNTGYFGAFGKDSQLPGVACCKGSVAPTPAPTPIPTLTPTPTPGPCLSGLLANGCFEDSSATASWNCNGAISGSCEGDSTIKYAGSSSVKITNTGGYWGWQLSQGNISASLGEQFCLSARVKKQSVGDAISLAIQESGGSWQEKDLWAPNSVDWQLVRSTVQVGSNWVLPIQVFLRAWYTNNAAWVDDISLNRGACL